MIDKKELYIHIGYPKTATTTFQTYLFPYHTELFHLKMGNDEKYLKFFNNIIFDRENAFERNIHNYKQNIEDIIKRSTTNKFIISEEGFTSFSMFFWNYPRPYIWTVEPNSVARKLKTLFLNTGIFNDVKVIVTIRNQADMLKSLYAQVYNLSYKKFKITNSFMNFLKYSFTENKEGFVVDSLMYYELIKTYSMLFGEENILILVFEELKNKKKVFLKKLTDFINIDYEEAVSLVGNKVLGKRSSMSDIYSPGQLSLYEYLNFYKLKYFGNKSFKLSDSFLSKIIKSLKMPAKHVNVKINDEYQKKIYNCFKENNKKLAKTFHLDLKEYKYY